jgi:serine/threonine protein kinase
MGEVFLARARGIEGFEKLVVLKTVLPQYIEQAHVVEMFLDEARLAAHLHHPNIAQVYDIGREQNVLYFTMEYIHGQDVRYLMKKLSTAGKILPLEHAINIVLGTAAALHYAHEQCTPDGKPTNLVHRDVSPSNILVSYDGNVKLVDFGVAKASTQRQETRAGTLKGKLAYMSPEQCHGQTLDRRSDIYALGIILYELSTGQRLFRAENDLAIMKQITEEDVPPPSWDIPDYPLELEKILLKALSRKREERYETAQAFLIDLEHFAREQKLATSAVVLGAFMQKTFADLIAEWKRAQHAGKSLGQHLSENALENDATKLSPSGPQQLIAAPPVVGETTGQVRGVPLAEPAAAPAGPSTSVSQLIPRNDRKPMWAAAVVLMLLALSVTGLWMVATRGPATVAQPTLPAPAPMPSPPAPAPSIPGPALAPAPAKVAENPSGVVEGEPEIVPNSKPTKKTIKAKAPAASPTVRQRRFSDDDLPVLLNE